MKTKSSYYLNNSLNLQFNNISNDLFVNYSLYLFNNIL
jgi:hypothetical protein